MKKLICTILALAALLSMGGCYKEKSKNKTCTHNWDKTTGICTLCNKQCTHKWDNASEYCSVCGISCITRIKEFVKASPTLIENGATSRTFTPDSSPDSNLTIAVSESGITVSFIQPVASLSSMSPGSTEQFTFTINNAVAKTYSFVFTMIIRNESNSYDSNRTGLKMEGVFEAAQVKNSESFRYLKHNLKREDYTGANAGLYDIGVEMLENQSFDEAAIAVAMFDKVLQIEKLGFTAANLGFRY